MGDPLSKGQNIFRSQNDRTDFCVCEIHRNCKAHGFNFSEERVDSKPYGPKPVLGNTLQLAVFYAFSIL